MDGQNGSSSICSRPHGTGTDGKKKKKEKEKEIPDRVTLKKEIGLLSACTIIIGEAGKQEGSVLPFTLLLLNFHLTFSKNCCRTDPLLTNVRIRLKLHLDS